MSMLKKKHWLILGLFLLTPTAFAQEEAAAGSNSIGLLGGFSTNKHMVLQTGIGVPGLQTKFLVGVLDRLDVGGILELNWSEIRDEDFALRFQGAIRYSFYDNGKVGLSAGGAPGLRVAFLGGGQGTAIDVLLHMDFSAGVRLTSNFIASVAFEIPLELWTKGKFSAFIPLVASTGLEYGVTSSFKLWAKISAGHGFSTMSGGSLNLFSFHSGAAFAF
ncbi:MAG: hypothetical protein FWC28_05250 [Proteobacteria bacterium]|nr:hypothetical protein [Cystobacterineae bacterium]MCL2259174.1 hypothetical protein [Cystobacterineae bacterium]MCL2314644.1 hypothetical protein [Pseudomonadota bacterium]